MENRTFYNEILTDHNLHPLHKEKLPDANLVLEGVNPSCGDDIILQLKVEDGQVSMFPICRRVSNARCWDGIRWKRCWIRRTRNKREDKKKRELFFWECQGGTYHFRPDDLYSRNSLEKKEKSEVLAKIHTKIDWQKQSAYRENGKKQVDLDVCFCIKHPKG